MSGGSYSYLCYAEAEKLMEKTEDLQNMADRLAGLGYAQDAAQETMDVLLTIRQFENRINAMTKRLEDIWKAVEWWDSCDTTEERVKEELIAYRKIDDLSP